MGKLFRVFSLSFPLRVSTFLLIFSFIYLPLFSQKNAEKDSLLQILRTLPEDTNKVNILNRLSYIIADRNNVREAIKFGERALKDASKFNFTRGILLAHSNLGYAYRISGGFDKAILNQKAVLSISNSIKDSVNIGESLRELGIIYRSKGDFSIALDFFLKALKMYEIIGKQKSQPTTLASIGALYYRQNKHKKSIEFFNNALVIHKKFKQENNIASDYNNLANVYNDLEEYDKALLYYNNYKKIKERLGDRKGIAIALSNISLVYINQKKFTQAIEYCLASLQIRDSLDLRQSKMFPLLNLSRAYAATKQDKKAIFYGLQALNISKEAGAKFKSLEITEFLSKVYKYSGDYKKALEYYQEHKTYADSVFNEKKSEQIAEMETKYDTEKKEQENKYLKLQDVKNKTLIRQSFLLNIAAVIGGGLLIILAVVLYRGNLRKQRTNRVLLSQKQEIEIQTEELKTINNELTKANALIKKDRDEKVKIYLQEATEATGKLQQIQEAFVQRGPEIAQKLLANEINTSGELSIIQEKVRPEFPEFSDTIDKALVDKKITKVMWQVGYCLKLGKLPAEIAKILPISNRTVSVYGTKLRKMGVLEAVSK